MTKNDRIVEYDILKGLGIIFMIIGHIMFSDKINTYIYSFHMPMFFLVSGIVYQQKTNNIIEYLKKQFHSLILPYMFFGIFFSVLFILLGHKLDVLSVLQNFISPNYVPFDWCGAIWFLLAIFNVKLIFETLSKIKDKNTITGLNVLLVSIGIYVSFNNIKIPFCIDSSLIGYSFFLIGKLGANKINSSILKEKRLKILIAQFIFFSIFSLICFCNIDINMRENTYGNFFIFYLSSISSIICWLLVSKLIVQHSKKISGFLSYINSYSIMFMGINQFIIAIFNVYIVSKFDDNLVIVLKFVELFFVIIIGFIVSVVAKKARINALIGKRG